MIAAANWLAVVIISWAAPQSTGASPSFKLGKPLVYENMTVFPVRDAGAGDAPANEKPAAEPADGIDRFMTLDEALRDGQVKFYEVGKAPIEPERPYSPPPPGTYGDPDTVETADTGPAAGTRLVVNLDDGPQRGFHIKPSIVVANLGDKPLYLMAGEVVVGSFQDRGIGWDSVVLPVRRHGRVVMYCVDHGRSTPRTLAQFQPLIAALAPHADQQQAVELCRRAAAGEFLFSPGILTLNTRLNLVAEECSQQQVWDGVAAANRHSGRLLDSVSFATYLTEPHIARQLDPYVNALGRSIEKQLGVRGVVVALNGRPVAIDLFESPILFRKLCPKVLRCYAADAAYAFTFPDAHEPCPTTAAADFLDQAARGRLVDGSEAKPVARLPRFFPSVVRDTSDDGMPSQLSVTVREAPGIVSAVTGPPGTPFGSDIHSWAIATDLPD